MKKYAKILKQICVLLVLVMLFAACQSSNVQSTTAAATTAAAQTTAATTAEATTAAAAETTAAAAAATTTAAATTAAATTTAAAVATEAATSADSGIDTSEFVNLSFYLISDPAPDYDTMLNVLNEKLKADINATVDIQWIGWGEREQKYPLVLASGEPIDAIFAGTWTWFYQEAAKGAYMDITDLAPIYMPRTYAGWDDITMKQISFNGRIYGIPTSYFSYSPMGYILRGDIADEVGFDLDIKSMDDYGEFMRLVAEKRPDMMTGDWTATSDDLLSYFARESGYCFFPSWPPITMDTRGEGEIVSIFDVDGVLEFFRKMKVWSDAGYWGKSVLADTSQNNLTEGRSASRLHNYGTWVSVYTAFPEWDARFYWTVPYTLKTRAMQDGSAIPASAKNPERALMMLELFHQEMDYWRMLSYGIEGIHYEINPDGTLKALDTDRWVPGGYCDWAFQREEWKLPVEGEPPNKQEVWDSFYTKAVDNPYAHFTVNFDNITNERAAVIATVTEYAKPLTYGYVADVDAGFAELKAKLDEAGLQVMMDEVNRQFAEFKAAN